MKFGRIHFVLIVALLVSNLLVGVLSLFFVRSVEERYAVLLDRSIPLINNLRTLTRELGAVQRLARRISDPQNEQNWSSLLPQMEEGSRHAEQRAVEISGADLMRDDPHVAKMLTTGRDYDDKVAKFLLLARAKKTTESNQYNIDVLRPAYDAYMDALDEVAHSIEREGNDLRARYAKDSRLFGGVVLAVAGWPLLAVGILLLVMGLLVIGLLAAVFFPKLFAPKGTSA